MIQLIATAVALHLIVVVVVVVCVSKIYDFQHAAENNKIALLLPKKQLNVKSKSQQQH